MYVGIDTKELEFFNFHVEIILEGTFLGEEIGIIPIIKVHFILGEGSAQVWLQPIRVVGATKVIWLDFQNSTSSKEPQTIGVILEIGVVPGSGDERKEREVHTTASPVPDHVQRVESVIEDGQR